MNNLLSFKIFTSINTDLSATYGSYVTNIIWTTTYNNILSRSANVVNIYAGGIFTPKTVNNGDTIGSVSSEYRPKCNVPLALRFMSSNSGTSMQYSSAIVQPNGNIIFNGSNATMGYIMLSGSWGV